MARKINLGATDNEAFSQMDKTALFFTQNCGACHPGGGSGEFDRDGNRYVIYNTGTGLWEYSPARGGVSYYVDPSVGLASGVSGDYAFVNPASPAVAAAPWQKTGVAEADCLMCHLPGYKWVNRTAALGKGAALVDNTGAPVPAFAAASAAGAGWAAVTFGPPPPGKMPQADTVTIAYPENVNDFVRQGIVREVRDENCRNCHATPDLRKAGRSWTPDTDVHKARGLTCIRCHPAGRAATDPRIRGRDVHEIAKGNITVGSARDDIDDTMRGCKACHVDRLDPAAPDPAEAHGDFPAVHFGRLSCNVCHIPYLEDSAGTPASDLPDLVLDYTVDGNGIIHRSDRFLSNNPVDPKAPLPGISASRWYPALMPHAGQVKTVKPLVTIWWGLWNGRSGSSAIVKPIVLRNLRKVIGFASGTNPAPPAGKSLVYTAKNAAGTTYYNVINTSLFSRLGDADGDNVVEVNTPAEIVAFIDAFAGRNDAFGQPIVPSGWQMVLVKAGKVYFKTSGTTVARFENPAAESPPFAINHNVRPSGQALGAGGCADCHAPKSPFFFRKELVDPYDETGRAVYVNAYETMGYTEARVRSLTAGIPGRRSE